MIAKHIVRPIFGQSGWGVSYVLNKRSVRNYEEYTPIEYVDVFLETKIYDGETYGVSPLCLDKNQTRYFMGKNYLNQVILILILLIIL